LFKNVVSDSVEKNDLSGGSSGNNVESLNCVRNYMFIGDIRERSPADTLRHGVHSTRLLAPSHEAL
jgi:hypothetical protein